MFIVRILFFTSLFSWFSATAQIETFDIYLGLTEDKVYNYLDSLNKLKSNVSYKVNRSVTDFGDLMLGSSFSINDEKFYKCLSINFVFKRIQGKEYCVQQLIIGNSQYAYPHLTFIKDKFKSIKENTWVLQSHVAGYLYKAFFQMESKNANEKLFVINYTLEKEETP